MADDALSLTNTIQEMQGIIELYAYFAKIYSVEYCVKKTIVNLFGTKEDKETLMNSDLQIGGVKPLFDESSVHLGLWLSEDLAKVAEINVDHRIKKTDNKLFGSLRNVIWDKTGHSTLETKIQLYTSLLRPSLLSGLNALCITGIQLKRLKFWEEWLLRKIFGLKENASTCGIYINTHLLPIEGHLHKSVLSLFYNAWLNKENPVVDVIKETMNDKDENLWSVNLKAICEKYRLPDPEKMLKEECPTKSSWKKMVDKSVHGYHSKLLNERKSSMRTLELLEKNCELDGKLEKCLSSRNKGSTNTIKLVNKLMIGEYKNQDWLKRCQLEDNDICTLCMEEREDVTHTLTNCSALNSIDSIRMKRRRLEETWDRAGLEQGSQKHNAAMILNPMATMKSRQQETITEIIEDSRSLVQELIFEREQQVYQLRNERSSRYPKGPPKGDAASERPQRPSEKDRSGDDRKTSGDTITQSQISKFINYFKGKERVPTSNPNGNCGDQLIVSVLNPGSTAVIGALCSEFGRVVIWRQILDEKRTDDDWNKALVILSDDIEVLMACRTTIIRTLNKKNSCKVITLKKLETMCIVYYPQISELSCVRLWPSKMTEDIFSTWKSNLKWPKGGVDKFGTDKSTDPTSLFCLWLTDCPFVSVTQMDNNAMVYEIMVKRCEYVSSAPMNYHDKRLSLNPQNLLGISRMFKNLEEDLHRIDENSAMKSLPRDASGIEEISRLAEQWDTIHNGNAAIRHDEMTDIIPILGARHMARLPSALVWKSKDICTLFMKLALPRPTMKSVEFEPIGRNDQENYEKELISLENHMLGDEDDVMYAEDMSGNVVDYKGNPIVFRMPTSVRTDTSKIPTRRVVELDLEELKGLAEYQKTMISKEKDLKNFKFTDGQKVVKTEYKYEYVEQETPIVTIKSEDERRDGDDSMIANADTTPLRSPVEPTLIPMRPTSSSSRRATPMKAIKRRREETDSEDSDDDDEDEDDCTSADGCINIIKKVKEANGTLTHEFQRSVKRLKKYNGRRLDRHTRKKMKGTMALTPKEVKTWKTLTIKPKSSNSTQELEVAQKSPTEHLLDESQNENTDDKQVLAENTTANTKRDTFMAEMDKFEAEIAGTEKAQDEKKTPTQGDEETGVFAFNPNITFGGSDNGKITINTSTCLTESVSRDRECPGLKPAQDLHRTLANDFIGKLKTREWLYYSNDKQCNSYQLCNLLLLFSCRVNIPTWAANISDLSNGTTYIKQTSVY